MVNDSEKKNANIQDENASRVEVKSRVQNI